MRHDDEIELFCSTGFSHPANIAGNSVRISCSDRGDDEDFQCRRNPYHTARRRTSERCFNNATLVDIGFEMGERFLIVLTVCHDERVQTTHYAHYRLTPGNLAAQRGIKRPSFIQSDFFPGKDINLLYGRGHQRKIIIKTDALNDYDDEKDVVYLSRGNRIPIISFFTLPHPSTVFN